jgi:ABC-type Mn2+/Zn2+ transport system ATPase subunit
MFLSAKNLQLSHGNRVGLFTAPVSFEIPDGKLSLLIGRNGEGKSTLFHALLGEDHILKGSLVLQVKGVPLSEPWRQVAYVPQDHPYQAALLVEDFLMLAFLPKLGIFGRLGDAERTLIDEKLETLGLLPFKKRRMGAISAGERQRVFLARALLQPASLLLLDEPTNHLDPAARELFWKAVESERLLRELDVLVISHDLEFIRQSAQWIVALRDRKLLFSGEASKIDLDEIFRKTFW